VDARSPWYCNNLKSDGVKISAFLPTETGSAKTDPIERVIQSADRPLVWTPTYNVAGTPRSEVLARLDRRPSTYAEVEWFPHRNFGAIKVTGFCGIPGGRDG
jgi:hypothetical protein